MKAPEVVFNPAPLSGMGRAQHATAASPRKLHHSRWTDSVWFALGFSALAGLVYALIVMGPRPLNPRNISWLTWDPVTSHIGWELFRQDPHFHWPLTYTNRVGYPQGEAVALMDVNALLAVFLKLFSPLLPEPFQYMGIEVVLASALQFYFAFRLFRLLLGPRPIVNGICSTFFVLSPPLTIRMIGHYALINHWLITAAVYLYFLARREEGRSPRNLLIATFTLGAVSVAINPYLAFQVLVMLSAVIITLVWQRRLSIGKATGAITGLAVLSLVVAYAFGFLIPGGHGYGSVGYRYYSMNLLAPVDPHSFKSVVFHQFAQFTHGQYEGYNYLGFGVILLLALATLIFAFKKHKTCKISVEFALPLLLACGLLTLMALSTRISFGSHQLVDIDPKQRLTSMLAVLRASGRLFWTPYYVILVIALATPFFLVKKSWATAMLVCALAIQSVDTRSLRLWVHSQVNQDHPDPLKSPIWSQLGVLHQNLVVLPAWQCGDWASAGGKEGYRFFGLLAAAQKMRINSYYSGRYSGAGLDYQCGKAVSELTMERLSPDSAYVVTAALAALIAQGPTGPGKCHDLDRVILCSVRTDFGLSSTLMSPAARLQSAIGNSGFEGGEVRPWVPYLNVKAEVTSAITHSGKYSLAESVSSGSVYEDVNGLHPGSTYTVSAWVLGSPGASATAQVAIYDPGTNSAAFSLPTHVSASWQLVTQSLTIGSLPTIRLHLFRNEGSGTVYWDDVHIYEANKANN